ncbi:hypothetical protein [Paenibacillus qinlingensis]|uniref:Uncharacterized protein n=1 Tax=Paenibacillus qinlingensis TaxID=1837343 RepID=A0ABU1P2L5_9BACL|nr:hypothetical protein [Paenibacillus qinlingensis]MDR6553990.1 hypothetical protein [Paenibacillus qinlingensis]
MQLRVVFKSIEMEKSLEQIIDELVNDTIKKVLTKHPGTSYNYETTKTNNHDELGDPNR